MTNMAIEMATEIMIFPFENGGSFHSCVYVYQRVRLCLKMMKDGIWKIMIDQWI